MKDNAIDATSLSYVDEEARWFLYSSLAGLGADRKNALLAGRG